MEIICICDCWGCDGIGQSQTVLAACTRSNPPPCDNLGVHSTEMSLKPCLKLMPCTGWNKHILWNISDYDQPLHTFTEVYMSCLSSACFLLQADTCCNIAYCCRSNKTLHLKRIYITGAQSYAALWKTKQGSSELYLPPVWLLGKDSLTSLLSKTVDEEKYNWYSLGQL